MHAPRSDLYAILKYSHQTFLLDEFLCQLVHHFLKPLGFHARFMLRQEAKTLIVVEQVSRRIFSDSVYPMFSSRSANRTTVVNSGLSDACDGVWWSLMTSTNSSCQQGAAPGAEGILIKPFALSELLAKVKDRLAMARNEASSQV
jgi:hypothetical protein